MSQINKLFAALTKVCQHLEEKTGLRVDEDWYDSVIIWLPRDAEANEWLKQSIGDQWMSGHIAATFEIETNDLTAGVLPVTRCDVIRK